MRLSLTVLCLSIGFQANATTRLSCSDGTAPVAEIAAVRGEAVATGESGKAFEVNIGLIICGGDSLQVKNGASVELLFERQNAVIGVHENSRLIIPTESSDYNVSIDTGLMRLISSVRSFFVVRTPYQDAGIKGTEFTVLVDRTERASLVLVREGQLEVISPASITSLTLGPGEASIGRQGAQVQRATPENVPPKFKPFLLNPESASDWAIYYPPVLLAKDVNEPSIREAAKLLQQGKPDDAIKTLRKIRLSDRASAAALSLQSIAAIFRNQTEEGLKFANEAVQLDPQFSPGYVAVSYALQSMGEIQAATLSAQRATEIDDSDTYAWARLAELHLVSANNQAARNAVKRSLSLQETALARAIEGFERLSSFDASAALSSFDRAIQLDSQFPLPRLGKGLALIKRTAISEGRQEIEIAVALDPRRASLRAWLGRAYLAEGLNSKAEAQAQIARLEDPDDPVADLVEAQAKFSANDPVSALRAIRRAQAKGSNRRTNRSRLGLAEDQAVRGVATGRIYDTLGFTESAIKSATDAVAADPLNPGAHRFLADLYRATADNEIAGSSEYLQAQILSPPSLRPVQPELGEADLGLLSVGGASRIAFHEFGPVFESEGLRLDASGVFGTQDTRSGQISATLLHGGFSLGVGAFGYETEGFRANNDLSHEIFAAEGKFAVSDQLTLNAEYRRRRTKAGDRTLEFDLTAEELRSDLVLDDVKLGAYARLDQHTSALLSARYVNASIDLESPGGGFFGDVIAEKRSSEAVDFQAKAIHSRNHFTLTGGFAYQSVQEVSMIGDDAPDFNHEELFTTYAYIQLHPIDAMEFTVGASVDYFDVGSMQPSKVLLNPKLGLKAVLSERATLRAFYSRGTQRSNLVEEQIEPTGISGFNQLSADSNGDLFGQRVSRAGLAFDFSLTSEIFGSLEATRTVGRTREMGDIGIGARNRVINVSGEIGVSLNDNTTAALGFRYENTKSDSTFFPESWTLVEVPVSVRHFHRSGFFFGADASLIVHDFFDTDSIGARRGKYSAVTLGGIIGYRLPNSQGVISLEARNLLNENIMLEDPLKIDDDPSSSSVQFSRDRSIFMTFSLNF